MKPSVKEIVHQYVNAWNNEGIEVFKTEFAKCLAPGVRYTDPNIEAEASDGIAALAQGSAEKHPGRVFRLITTPEHHHNVARYTWDVELPDGRVEGYDILEFNADGLITRIITFF